MCNYSVFQYLCTHHKLKIIQACSKAFKDPHGVLTCPDAPNATVSDGTPRTFGQPTYGLGVCGNIHCAWKHSILPIGEYGNFTKFGKGKSTSFEDDTEIEDSPAAREDRVDRWYRELLDDDQQLDHITTEYPVPENELSDGGRILFKSPHGAAGFMDLNTLRWQELNPLYLTPQMLQWCVLNLVLPAFVVDDRKSNTITPRQPIFGPFQVPGDHECTKKRGICGKCGVNNGEVKKKEKVLSYRQTRAFAEKLLETPIDGDLKDTAWDSNVKLKWDDAKDEYRTISTNSPTNSPVRISDAPYPASSNPAFVPATAQATAVFSGQEGYLADSSTYASAEFALTDEMDWDGFATNATLNDQPSTTFIDNSWPTSGYSGHDSLPTMSQSEPDMNNFSSDPNASFTANHDTTYNIDAGNNVDIDFGLSDPQLNVFINEHPSNLDTMMYQSFNNQSQTANHFSNSLQTSDAFSSSTNPNEHNMLFSSSDLVSQDIESDSIDDPMDTSDSGEGQPTLSLAFRPSTRKQ